MYMKKYSAQLYICIYMEYFPNNLDIEAYCKIVDIIEMLT